MLYEQAKFLPAGDRSLVMEFGDTIDPAINARIRSMAQAIEEAKDLPIEEIIPTYRSIQIFYSPLRIDVAELQSKLRSLEEGLPEDTGSDYRIVEIPVVYGGDYGPDLSFVAEHNQLTEEEVIRIHTGTDYLLYMLGFTPGFSYLGGMSEAIATPRLIKPRVKIPAGSVGIAGTQTGVYPIDSPGGWQLIGKTPLRMYDPLAETPVLLKAGDYVRFVEIDEAEFEKIAEAVTEGSYQVKISQGGELRHGES